MRTRDAQTRTCIRTLQPVPTYTLCSTLGIGSVVVEQRKVEDALCSIFAPKRKTLMFNGYNDVASLYTGMDLRKFF